MMRFLCHASTCIVLVALPAAHAGDIPALPDYSMAIGHANFTGKVDRRFELNRCVKLWDAVSDEREHLAKAIANKSAEAGRRGVLLEMGGSGFPRYDFVRIEGFTLSSSFNSEIMDISETPLGKRVAMLYSSANVDLPGSDADGPEDDAGCYFLTLTVNGASTSAALYGDPSPGVAGSLVREILLVVNPGELR